MGYLRQESADGSYTQIESWTLGELAKLPVASFQPKLKPRRIKLLRENWDLNLMEEPSIGTVEATGELVIYEGRHRHSVALEMLGPDHEVPVRHTYGRDAALLYRKLGTSRRKMGSGEIYDSGVEGRDSVALGMKRVAEDYDFRFSQKTEGVRTITAISTCQEIYTSSGGKQRFADILDMLDSIINMRHGFPVAKNKWASARVIQAIDYLLVALPALRRDVLVNRLASLDNPDQAAPMNANSARKNAEAMLEKYNYRLHEGKGQLDFPSDSEVKKRYKELRKVT